MLLLARSFPVVFCSLSKHTHSAALFLISPLFSLCFWLLAGFHCTLKSSFFFFFPCREPILHKPLCLSLHSICQSLHSYTHTHTRSFPLMLDEIVECCFRLWKPVYSNKGKCICQLRACLHLGLCFRILQSFGFGASCPPISMISVCVCVCMWWSFMNTLVCLPFSTSKPPRAFAFSPLSLLLSLDFQAFPQCCHFVLIFLKTYPYYPASLS